MSRAQHAAKRDSRIQLVNGTWFDRRQEKFIFEVDRIAYVNDDAQTTKANSSIRRHESVRRKYGESVLRVSRMIDGTEKGTEDTALDTILSANEKTERERVFTG